MKAKKQIVTKGVLLENAQLAKYLEELAAEQIVSINSKKSTYPIIQLKEDFKFITKVYTVLNEHIKMKITIHPAGEWLLDNYYIINENVKVIEDELNEKKYKNLPGVIKGQYDGYSRIYALSSEIIAHKDNKIDKEIIELSLNSYQKIKMLDIEEMWSIPIFLKIILIKNIRNICETIYISEMQKENVINIINNTIEGNKKNRNVKKEKLSKNTYEMKYSFIEYMSYKLKKYGKNSLPYLQILEEQVKRAGSTVDEIINKQHYAVAKAKVSIGNAIISLKSISRINFQEIFEDINGVEEVLKQDPAKIYDMMTQDTKTYYRQKVQEISEKTNLSEMYITKNILELAKSGISEKTKHVGYYLIDKGINKLLTKIDLPQIKIKSPQEKSNKYIISNITVPALLTVSLFAYLSYNINIWMAIILSLISYIPITEIYIQLVNYCLSKMIKTKKIPKLDFGQGVPQENSTFVVIPTILNSKSKVKELIKKLEVYYIANKSENIYFALLGDCTTSDKIVENFDKDIIKMGITEIEKLNSKYKKEGFPIFHFLYRKRKWCATEKKYLGWERKRGLLTQFNKMLIEKTKEDFEYNSILNYQNIPQIKYIITLDSDTKLTLNSGLELIGAISHPLNKVVINNGIVTEGYGIIQPRVGVDLEISNKNLFTMLFAGTGGIDSYSSVAGDIYQDAFDEAIYTGKGIYDLNVFYKLLDKIPENTVLSHDLLEGSYLRCGYATDIILIDGYPTKYNSYIARSNRWIRGDWQISKWLFSKIEMQDLEKEINPLNILSKYKIYDNLRRSLVSVFAIILIIFDIKIIPLIAITTPSILELINNIIFKKQVSKKENDFLKSLSGVRAAILKGILEIAFLPDKAYNSIQSIIKTLYRLKSRENLLEWITAEEAEKVSKTDLKSYYKKMFITIIFAIIAIIKSSLFYYVLGLLWLIAPFLAWYISKENNKKIIETISEEEKKYIREVAQKTWKYFSVYMNKENNYLPPDNVQGEKVANRTSSTNIGLGILTIITAYDLKFIDKNECKERLKKILEVIDNLEKWNGHLYNWYDTKTLKPLYPRYISTVDSGNFIGYLYTLKMFLIEELSKEIELIRIVDEIIIKTDFSKLYDEETRLFSIGFNIEENKLTNSYYDFLASEARQASLIAIAKKDVPSKHWRSLSRTLTSYNGYKGLISWSGTAFEYLMPNINIKKYSGSLLDESCKFAIMCQQNYAKKFEIPWGISETAFNLKDLHGNYQYKAFGIPTLGQKRGLSDDIVISPYASVLAIIDEPKKVISNLKALEQYNMYNEYGFYESIDFTPTRLKYNQKYAVVKTYMAHHQGLILVSINNLLNNNIMIERFSKNSEIESVDIILQERMPQNVIIKQVQQNKHEKLKYNVKENYLERNYKKTNPYLKNTNVISNGEYTIFTTDEGTGYSKYNNEYINRYKVTADERQGVEFYIKNIKSNIVWNPFLVEEKSEITFTEAKSKFKSENNGIEVTCDITLASEEMIEIRRIELKNTGLEESILEISSYFEPVLSKPNEDYAHPVFNNLFLDYEYEDENIIIRRKNKNNLTVATTFYTENENIGNLEFETDKTKLLGRNNINIPIMIKNSIPFSNKVNMSIESIVAFRKTMKIKPQEKVTLNILISVGEEKQKVINIINEYKNQTKIDSTFNVSKARVESENCYLDVEDKEIEIYQKLFTNIFYKNSIKKLQVQNINQREYLQSELWEYGISGDNPILLIKIKDMNEMDVLKEVLKFYEYSKSKNMKFDCVIINKEENKYEKYIKYEIEGVIQSKQLGYLINNGIYILENINGDKEELFDFVSKIIINAQNGGLKTIIEELEEEYIKKYNYEFEKVKINDTNFDEIESIAIPLDRYKYYNEYGGFSQDGKEYHIIVNKNNKLPNVWSHVLANEKFGTVVTDNMGGYTWAGNSRLKRITAWNNNPTLDIPSEIIYFKNNKTGKIWTLNHGVIPDNKKYHIIYGFGYAIYSHTSDGILQENNIFVSKDDEIKINIIRLKNLENIKKSLKLVYYLKPVLDEDEIISNTKIQTKKSVNSIYIKNLYVSHQDATIFSNYEIKSYTSNKDSFLENGNITMPIGLKKERLDNNTDLSNENCIAFEIEVNLEAFETREIIIGIGKLDSEQINKYKKIEYCYEKLEEVKKFWNETLNKIQIKTPLESVNIMLNGWVLYQTIASRLWARSGYYQSGGAFGFRDQLQDSLGLKYIDTNFLKNQILKAASHQFIEGDVEHWWHEETSRGIRTRFSDDLLWLCYAVLEYLEFTGDYQILNEEVFYRNGKILEENQNEHYDFHELSKQKGTIYEHCIRAINKAINIGENGLIKIGSGDWNDGFSNVGIQGKGESVWVSFFIYDILTRFIEICNKQNNEELAKEYYKIKEEIKKNINNNAWDGRWYKRAFMDSGEVLGSIENDECKIDSIAQSWSVISNAGNNDRKYISMESLEKYLVDKENGIIKLLTPGFKDAKINPGYIKNYPDGVRENGGQYTHAAIWAIIAETLLGFGNKANELYKMITPIEHARTKEMIEKYKVEPYVIPADVCGGNNYPGRGGWTWYTGSSSWYYKAGIEYILGIKIIKGILKIEPCIPKEWKEYSVRYRHGETIYNIKVKNQSEKSTGVEKFILNGKKVEEKQIKLLNDGSVNNIEIIM